MLDFFDRVLTRRRNQRERNKLFKPGRGGSVGTESTYGYCAEQNRVTN